MWAEVLSVRAGVGGGGDHVSRSRGGGTGGDERELAALRSVGVNAEDSVLRTLCWFSSRVLSDGCVVKLRWSV